MSDLENARPGKVGKAYPAGSGVNGNSAPVAQANNYDNTPKWVVVLSVVMTVLALMLAFAALYSARDALDDARDALREARDAASAADRALDRAGIAEREGRLAEEAAMHLRSTMRAYGISINPGGTMAGIQDDLSQEEPIEP